MSKSKPATASSAGGANSAFFPHGGGPTLEGVANLISHSSTRNIVILAGAGISTSAVPPIPDFRTPGTGLYSNLEQYNLPYAEAIFDIEYFQRKPSAFFTLAKELYPGNFKPALAHYFFTLLHEKGKLLRVFTQNVDTLERISGLPEDKVVEAHGSFATSTCTRCKKSVEPSWMKEKVMAGEIARCPDRRCQSKTKDGKGGLVKPDIVFFGEGLPTKFFARIKDLQKADLLIVLGTSLQVHPFAGLVDAVDDTCPRLLINLERVGELAGFSSGGGSGMRGWMNETGFDFDGSTYGGKNFTRDVFWEGKADEGVLELARHLGWEKELLKLRDQGHATLDREWGNDSASSLKNDSVAASNKDTKAVAEEVAKKVGKAASSPPEKDTASKTEPKADTVSSDGPSDSQKSEEASSKDGAIDSLTTALEKTELKDGAPSKTGEAESGDKKPN